MTMLKEQLETEEIIPLSKEEKLRFHKLDVKKQKKVFEIAFCGHFSAGKSTILNALLGAKILPTSPIPTSANIIKIQNGDIGLILRTKDTKEQSWQGKIPWNKVREWGMNNHHILGMTIMAPLAFLGNHSAIIDTPGIDSTDDTHEALTVEQLFTTDAIVYVMDYNHVLSETNLNFLKQLSMEQKPIFIIVNQVDKHSEKEISFSMFKQSMQEVFHQWNIKYLEIYFTSMKQPDHPLNQFSTFEKQIKSLLYHSQQLLKGAQIRLEQGFYKAVENRMQEEKLEALDDIIDDMKQNGYQINELEKQNKLNKELEGIQKYDQIILQNFESKIGSLFKNVTLFPYITTDLARNWIESLQPNYRVGLLFSKKKTIEEQEKRLERLVSDLQNKVKSQLLFHVKDYFQHIDRSKLSNKVDFEEAINLLSFQVTPDWLTSRVKKEYSSREYVFSFTSEITELIVKDIRDKASLLVSIQIEGMRDFFYSQEQSILSELTRFKAIEVYQLKIDNTVAVYDDVLHRLHLKFTEFPPSSEYNHSLIRISRQALPELVENSLTAIDYQEEGIIDTSWTDEDTRVTTQFSEEKNKRWLSKLKESLLKNKVLPQERTQLLERITRYENQTFMVSLFGAFSAGKSSFANALLGDYVLPVSPNPTTATISTIEKSNRNYPHGTVRIVLKTPESLNEEIKTIGEQLDITIDLAGLTHWKPNMQNYATPMQKNYAGYLITIKRSVEKLEWELGKPFYVGLSELKGLIAEESKACLINQVNIYYDSTITNQGVILVDTPGINSVYGRHTNVAFQQLRQSDAIFYLTYYNHAFSRADQYFLQQIGKVNHSFRHDKLYFIINASDLAAGDGELNSVKKHVYHQLLRNGIEHPRLYHLSSKEGLQAKKEAIKKKNAFSNFEHLFYEQTILELKQLSHQMIVQQLQQFLGKISDSILFMNKDSNDKRVKYELLKDTVMTLIERVQNTTYSYVVRDILHEFEQLILYLQNRMRLVLNDYFSTTINVAVLTGSNKKELHKQLTLAMKEWKGLGEFFLKQEIEATVLRIEEKIKELGKKWIADEVNVLRKELPYLYCEVEVAIAPITFSLQDLHISIEPSRYFSFLKSKKNFFENGVVKEFKEKLLSDTMGITNQMISEVALRLNVEFENVLSFIEKDTKLRIVAAIQQEVERFETLLTNSEKAAFVEEYDMLTSLLEELNNFQGHRRFLQNSSTEDRLHHA